MYFIDIMSRTPIYEQIVEQTEELIIKELLLPGAKMPSIRSLSSQLSTNPNTIQKAISELDRRELITCVPGKGCYISQNAKDIISDRNKNKTVDFHHLTEELFLSGVKKEQLINIIEEVYKNDKN